MCNARPARAGQGANVVKGKTVIVTGASEGIGRALARAIAAKGANLVLAARNRDALEELAAQCAATGASAVAIPTDVSDPDACRSLVDEAVREFGGIDILVNNAGISMRGRVAEIRNLSVFDRVMRVNYLGAVYCTHAAIPHLIRSKGLIVAVSSLQGKTGFPASSGYSASKFAMQGFFDSLRIELAGTGVDVLIVFPGAVDTPIHTRKIEVDPELARIGWKPRKNDMMSVDECVARMIAAMEQRRRELILTIGGKLIPWIRLVAPRFVDRSVTRRVARFYSTER
jgi:short-subunit dehydrogenase